jgi:phosphinothricin acetyltransferase
MTGDFTLRNVRDTDREAIIRIFNHYAATGFAAYPDNPVPAQLFDILKKGTIAFYVIEGNEGVVGFGVLKPFMPFPAFSKTGMLTYFVAPEYTHRGLGEKLLEALTHDAKDAGINLLVANLASKNEPSFRFHYHHGFTEAGRLHETGARTGEPYDVIWMEKEI